MKKTKCLSKKVDCILCGNFVGLMHRDRILPYNDKCRRTLCPLNVRTILGYKANARQYIRVRSINSVQLP